MIKSVNEITTYPEVKISGKDEKIYVENHWNDSAKVLLKCGEKEYIILAKDLLAAIANATNTARF